MLFAEPKFLVISTVGDNSLHRYWSKSSKFDTCLIYYGNKSGYPHESKYYKKDKGPKFRLIADILEEYPELQEYTYIWMPDDDIYLSRQDVESLFEINLKFDLQISQPSILGYYGTSAVLNAPGSILRYTNWVEIMCPVLSRTALQICKETFRDNITGWSIDAAWNVLLNHPRNKIAIIDSVAAIHTRPVFGGDTYGNLDGQNPLEEAWRDALIVKEKYNLTLEAEKDTGVSLGQGEVYNVVMYSKETKEMEGQLPRKERFWPPMETLEQIIEKIKNPQNLV